MDLSRKQYLNIKGFGIFLIMIHNFLDHLFKIECNEMTYSQQNTEIFLSNLSSNPLGYIFSFAGWIGVPLFFFLSGYGLSKKYGKQHIDIYSYIKSHAIKLWKLLIPVYFLYIIVSHYFFGLNYQIKGVFCVITFTANCFADTFFEPGVYWFFGAIFQFYIIYLIIRKFKSKWLFALMIAFLLIHYYALYSTDLTLLYIRYNFVGWTVPFIMGILYERNNVHIPMRYNAVICIVSFVGLCISLITKAFTPFIEIFMIFLTISFVKTFSFNFFAFGGIVSSCVFVIHPFVRMILKNTFFDSNFNNPLFLIIIYVLITLSLSWGYNLILHKGRNKKRRSM